MSLLRNLVLSFLILLTTDGNASAVTQVIFLTSGTSWIVPGDWNKNANSIECIGGGAGAGNGTGGAGGGAYSKITNLPLSAGASIPYSVGAAGSGANATNGNNGGDT